MSDELKPRGPNSRPIPAVTFTKLRNVIRLANGSRGPAFEAALADLLQDIPAWQVGIPEEPAIVKDADGSLGVCLRLNKPRGEGRSDRLFDCEAVLVFLGHFVTGGRLSLSPQGGKNALYYPRFGIGRGPAFYVLPIICPPPLGQLVEEPQNYHDLRRRHFVRSRRPQDDEVGSWLERVMHLS